MKINDRELEMGVAGTKHSWHQEYKDSAWVFIGGMPYELTEGDVICMFSQYGEVVHINLIRDHTSGKSKGFGFLCYQDQRSTILAVDNLNGFKILGRMIRVDHIHQYKLPKDLEKLDQDKRQLLMEGVAPKLQSDPESLSEEEDEIPQLVEGKKKKSKKDKKDKKKHKKKKKKKDRAKSLSDASDSESEEQDKLTRDQDKVRTTNGSNGDMKDRARSPYRRDRTKDRDEDRSPPRRKRSRSREKSQRSRSREKYARSRSRDRMEKRRRSRSRERRRN